jgi:hypothetical protein
VKPFFLKESYKLAGFSELLLSSKGTITMCAASVGRSAHCSDAIGSCFTRSFLKTIRELGNEESLSWEKVCRRSVDKTVEFTNDYFDAWQHPIYHIE